MTYDRMLAIGVSTGLLTALGAAATVQAAGAKPDRPRVDFNRDIRPILSDNCFRCHGPDEKKRKAGLRFDTRQGAFADLDGHRALVAGDLAASAVYQRITADDVDDRMPPPASGKSLTAEQIALIRRWIEQGAEWQEHWSFVAPERPALPTVKRADWPRNAIDYFILSRVEQAGLTPSDQTDPRTLIRRVSFDLTGLPPTPAEIETFVNDSSSSAYERLVDRLLDSPHYGEHMARFWLDAARYGDTHGLHLDNYREMWLYRDWVINAFNANLPYDAFTIQQLAGDLLPDATLDQQIATGFNRCHVSTNEGGSIKEEVYVRNVVDRVETTGTIFLGLTVGCAVCHDHKFDPIAQKEFYQLFAFFNNLDGNAMDGNTKDPAPVVRVLSDRDRARRVVLRASIQGLEAEANGPREALDAAQAQWETKLAEAVRSRWHRLKPQSVESAGGARLEVLDDESVLAAGDKPAKDTYRVVARTDTTGIQAVRLEALTHSSLARGGTGRAGNGNFVLTGFEAEARSITNPKQRRQVRFVAAYTDYAQKGFDVARAIDGKSQTGWAVSGSPAGQSRSALFVPAEPFGFEGGTELHVALHHESRRRQHAIGRFRLSVTDDPEAVLAEKPSKLGPWHSLGPFIASNFDEAHETAFGPEKTPGEIDLSKKYVDDKLAWITRAEWKDGVVNNTLEGESAATYLYRTIEAPTRRRMTISLGSDDSLLVWINGQQVFNRKVTRGAAADQDTITIPLEAGTNHLLMKVCNSGGGYGFYFKPTGENTGRLSTEVAAALVTNAEQRDDAQRAALRAHYRREHWPKWKELTDELDALRKQDKEIVAKAPTTLVFKERAQPRDAFILRRGQYDIRQEKVSRKTPAILPAMADDLPRNRLGLARWLVDGLHPLTARVAVNRFWLQCFGTGIVKTAEDFGSRGEPPSHPELLDSLATRFVADGWDVKKLMKQIVMSATYRQSARMDPALLAKDPENRLLARGPRFRLDAEMLRDQAFAIAGLLSPRVGGPSVKPPQPDGLWFAVGYSGSNTVRFKQDRGEKIFRRSVYTFWKRTAPPPTMRSFDAPSREACRVRRERTNTPLQALVLMNEQQYVEAARHLARRVIHEGGSTAEQRVIFAFQRVTGRPPDPQEVADIVAVLNDHRAHFESDLEAAGKLIRVGESKPDTSINAGELAAWTMVANLLLNLDEALTKG